MLLLLIWLYILSNSGLPKPKLLSMKFFDEPDVIINGLISKVLLFLLYNFLLLVFLIYILVLDYLVNSL